MKDDDLHDDMNSKHEPLAMRMVRNVSTYTEKPRTKVKSPTRTREIALFASVPIHTCGAIKFCTENESGRSTDNALTCMWRVAPTSRQECWKEALERGRGLRFRRGDNVQATQKERDSTGTLLRRAREAILRRALGRFAKDEPPSHVLDKINRSYPTHCTAVDSDANLVIRITIL